MSQFSETLTRLMRQKHLKSVELCEILSIRKSRFSKIKNGGILPTDFSLVEKLAKAMHLNPQEEKELYLSYQMSKFGHTYEQIEVSMKRLYEVECPQYYQKEECLDTPVSAENGHLYTNKMAVLAAVQRLCLNTASVRIAIQPEDQDLLEILGRCVASCGDTVSMQWLFWLEPSDGGISAANLDVFSKALPVICAGRMEIRCTYGALPELLEQHLFPYFIVTERGALTISRDCTKAMWFCQPATVSLYEKQYAFLFDRSNPFCHKFFSLPEFFQAINQTRNMVNERQGEELYILAKHPCISSGISERDLQTMYLSEEESGYNANICYAYLVDYITRAKCEHIIFSEQGMQEFFQNDLYYEYSESISTPIPKERRYEMLSSILKQNSDRWRFQMLKYSFMDHANIHGLDIWNDGAIILVMNFHENFFLITLKEKSISSAILAYLHYLEELKVLSPSAETADMLLKKCQFHQKTMTTKST